VVGLNTKLVLIFILLSVLPVSAVGYISVSRTVEKLKEEAVEKLETFSRSESEKINLILSKIAATNKDLAELATNIYNNPDSFYHPERWSAESLFRGSQGQYGNSAEDPSSVIVFNWYPFNEETKKRLTLISSLDFVFPSIYKQNPNIKTIYIVGPKYGWYWLYPNSDPKPGTRGGFAMDSLPPDLNKDGVAPVFWDDLDEIHNPDRLAQWTPPYVDATGKGLMVSSLAPVYEKAKMVGLTGVDIALEDITTRILGVKLWKTGYAFIIDKEGRLVSLPQRAVPDLEWKKETLELAEIRKYNLLEVKNQELNQIARAAVAGLSGLDSIRFGGREKYIAYHPIKDAGWSLGAVVPVNEVIANALVTRSFIFVVLAGIIAVLIAFIILSARLITGPIKEVTQGAEEISKGNLSYRIRVRTKDEIEVLGDSFNEMAARLKESYSNLEAKVALRTYELSQEKNRIQAVLTSIADGVFVIDKARKLALVNPAVIRITGFKQKDLLGKIYYNVLKFVKEKREEAARDFIEKALLRGKLYSLSNHSVIIAKDGKKIPIASSAAPLKDEEGEIQGVVVVFQDVTKERELDRIKSEFISLASHQLRTPITIIKWGIEALLHKMKKKLARDELDQIDKIYKGSEKMAALVDDLLNVSRLEAGRLIFKKEFAQLEEMLDAIIKEYELYLEKKKMKLFFEKPASSLPKVEIDREKIRQVIIILLDNAIKYSPKGKKIQIKLSHQDETILFSIKDEGIGIPVSQQKEVFTKFFRAENISEETGTGLGLYLAQGLVRAHGGKIWFESEEGKGTTFYFTLPIK